MARRGRRDGTEPDGAAMTEVASSRASVSELRELLAGLLGVAPAEVDVDTPLVELGADSLVLLRASQLIRDRFGVEIPFRDMLGRYPTVRLLVPALLGGESDDEPTDEAPLLPPVGPPRPELIPPPPEAGDGSTSSPAPTASPPAARLEPVAALVQRQLELMREQLILLGAAGVRAGAPAPGARTPTARRPADAYVPQAAIAADAITLTEIERAAIDRLVRRIAEKTAGSKARAASHRRVHADSRMSASFQPAWKELVYPVVAERSAGSRFTDVDGNEYVDITMDYGVNLFGHSAPFIREAIVEQAELGMAIGPQPEAADETAQLLAELAGVERVAFVASGTEAVMTAVRVARTATRRPKIAVFAGCYHGSFDGILARASTSVNAAAGAAAPIAPGTPDMILRDVVVAEYASPTAFELLRAHRDELAAIVVEPVQSRRPDVQPQAWLQQLREVATEIGAALVFDEIITGFRVHPGGAQAYFGVPADLVTYGKVVGGGMPIGVVAGRGELMDAIDGGYWSYGDDSWPQAAATFFAGTFWKHPLVMAATRAVLLRLRDEGESLQQRLTARTSELVERLNDGFTRIGAPVRVVSFASLFRFVFDPGFRFHDLFFYQLLDRGVYVWEGRTCFLSTAHTEEDVTLVAAAAIESIQAMQHDGLAHF
jgi:glutamate-1-semialdehyde aminotransferase/acyl carrier protein